MFTSVHRNEICLFLNRKQPRFGHKSQSERDLKRKAGSTALGDIDGQLGMLPILELVLGHVEVATCDLAKPDIRRTYYELTLRITHRRRTVTAPAALMEHKLAVF